MYVYFFKIITGKNEKNCIYCYSPYLKQNISVFTFFAYFLTINMVSGKFSFWKINTQKIPTHRIPPWRISPTENSNPENPNPEYSISLFFHYYHRYHYYCLKDCFVFLFLKNTEVRLVMVF